MYWDIYSILFDSMQNAENNIYNQRSIVAQLCLPPAREIWFSSHTNTAWSISSHGNRQQRPWPSTLHCRFMQRYQELGKHANKKNWKRRHWKLDIILVSYWGQYVQNIAKSRRPRNSDHFKSVDISVSVFHSNPWNVFVQSRVAWRMRCQASNLRAFTCWLAFGW